MVSTFHGLEVAKRGLFVQQSALSTTAHNVANANTEGYTRQRAEMQATTPVPYPGLNIDRTPGQIGTGVEVTKLVRLRDDYLDVQIRGENKKLGYNEAKSDTLSKMEELLNEPSDIGLANTMDQFFNSWQELAKNPDSAAARAVVRQRGAAVAETFNYLAESLDQMQTDLKTVIATKVKDINSYAQQISNLNEQIANLVPNNFQPNDLYDQRDLLIDKLSKLVDVTVTHHKETGVADISVGGVLLVEGLNAKTISVQVDSGPINPDDIRIDGETISLNSGELLARMESYGITGNNSSSSIPNLKDKLNNLAVVFATKVNEVHQSGLNLNNIYHTSTEQVPFFTGSSANDLKVNQKIMDSLNWIAAAKIENSETGESSAGNGENAKEMAAIRSANLSFPGATSTAADFYRNIIGQLGIDSQEAQRMRDNADVIVQQIENRRQSISGVSLDEEMANMIKFQQAYNAAARVVTVMDEVLDTIINRMGRS